MCALFWSNKGFDLVFKLCHPAQCTLIILCCIKETDVTHKSQTLQPQTIIIIIIYRVSYIRTKVTVSQTEHTVQTQSVFLIT